MNLRPDSGSPLDACWHGGPAPMVRFWTYRLIPGVCLCATALFPVDIPLPAELLPRLDKLTQDAPLALRLVDGEEITTAKLVAIDAKTLSYDTGFRTVQLERLQIYKAVQNNTTYSDYPIRKAESQNYPRYESFVFERGDILIETYGKKTFGLIVSMTPDQFVMRTDSGEISVPRHRVVAWRKSGVSFGEPEVKVAKKDAAPKRDPHKENRFPIEISGFLAGPWCIFPQAGFGLGSDVSMPIFVGLRGTLGTMDMRTFALLKQASLFVNLNFARSENYVYYLGASLLWRNGTLVDKIYSAQPGNSVQISMTQTRYTLHLGFRSDHVFMEAGMEFGISNEEAYYEPPAQSITDASNIRLAASRVLSSKKLFDTMSQVHLVMGILF